MTVRHVVSTSAFYNGNQVGGAPDGIIDLLGTGADTPPFTPAGGSDTHLTYATIDAALGAMVDGDTVIVWGGQDANGDPITHTVTIATPQTDWFKNNAEIIFVNALVDTNVVFMTGSADSRTNLDCKVFGHAKILNTSPSGSPTKSISCGGSLDATNSLLIEGLYFDRDTNVSVVQDHISFGGAGLNVTINKCAFVLRGSGTADYRGLFLANVVGATANIYNCYFYDVDGNSGSALNTGFDTTNCYDCVFDNCADPLNRAAGSNTFNSARNARNGGSSSSDVDLNVDVTTYLVQDRANGNFQVTSALTSGAKEQNARPSGAASTTIGRGPDWKWIDDTKKEFAPYGLLAKNAWTPGSEVTWNADGYYYEFPHNATATDSTLTRSATGQVLPTNAQVESNPVPIIYDRVGTVDNQHRVVDKNNATQRRDLDFGTGSGLDPAVSAVEVGDAFTPASASHAKDIYTLRRNGS